MAKCYVCGEEIDRKSAIFLVRDDGEMICAKHAVRTNKVVLDKELVEKVLEEEFGGEATICGNAKFVITY